MSNEAIVTIPPDVVRTRASSTVFVKASSRVNLDLAGIFVGQRIPNPFEVSDYEVEPRGTDGEGHNFLKT